MNYPRYPVTSLFANHPAFHSFLPLPSSTLIAASLILETSLPTSFSLTCEHWVFDNFIGATPTLGIHVGDHITIYRHTFDMSSRPLPSPAFTGTIKCIIGWPRPSEHPQFVEFLVACDTIGSQGPTTCNIRFPLQHVKLSWLQQIWKRFVAWPKSTPLPERPPFGLMPKLSIPSYPPKSLSFRLTPDGRPLWRPTPPSSTPS
jgi:hypothetical protein